MKTFTCVSTGQLITLTKEIADSGEGKVWETNRNGYLAKIYHAPIPERIEKLKVMIACSPLDPNSHLNHISFAWPKSLLKDSNGTYVGFLMPAITGGKDLLNVYNPLLRKTSKLEIDWRFLHATALNIALVIQAIHAQGYVLGDIKPQNILVNNRALPSIIDTDSFQVYHPITSQVYRCQVGSTGFTPPELIGKDFSTTNQTDVHDRFRLAVIIYHLLFGNSPFTGKWVGSGEQLSPDELIKRGFWVHGVNSLLQPGDITIPLNIVHPEIQRCFLKCFNDGYTNPNLRPSAAVWVMALKLAINNLNICGKVDRHYFSRTYEKCYWCERANYLNVDIFASSASTNSMINKTITSSSTVNQAANQAVIQPTNQTIPQSMPLSQASQTPTNSNSEGVIGTVMTVGFIIWIFLRWKVILIIFAFLLILGLIVSLIQGLISIVKNANIQAKKQTIHNKLIPINPKYLVVIGAAIAIFIGWLGLINLAGFGTMNVLSPKEVLQSTNSSVQTANPTQASSAPTSPSLQKSAPVMAEVSPEQAIIDYYSNINNHLYNTGWSTLTNRFKNLNPGIKGGYQEYLDWWKSVQRAQIQNLKLVSITSTEAVVDARIKYFMKTGNVTSSSLRFFLVKNATKTSWLLNDISHI